MIFFCCQLVIHAEGEWKQQQPRQQHPLILPTDTRGQSCKNIVLLSRQSAADRGTNSMWQLLVMQKKRKKRNLPHQWAHVKVSFFYSNKHAYRKSQEQGSKPVAWEATGESAGTQRWGGCRPSLSRLPPRGVRRYFHFTNNLKDRRTGFGKWRSHWEVWLSKHCGSKPDRKSVV